MTDNIRPALYQAEYDCDLAANCRKKNRESDDCRKMCESGDVVIKEAYLPKAESGDLLAVYSTGAYGYSMSSNYNRALTTSSCFVNNGQSRLIVRRQAFEDLLGEVSYDPA